MCTNFWTKQELCLLGPKFAQKWILGSEFQKSKSGFGIDILEILCAPIFRQNGQLWIFRPKFGEIAQLRAIFWFEYYWGYCRELDGGWHELCGGGWSWLHAWVISNKVLLSKSDGILSHIYMTQCLDSYISNSW